MTRSYKVSARESTVLELGAPDTVKSVLQAIKIILTTPKGTVPMYRDFGVNIGPAHPGRGTAGPDGDQGGRGGVGA